jgi:hypothetical protein
MFRNNKIPPSSGTRIRESRNQHLAGNKSPNLPSRSSILLKKQQDNLSVPTGLLTQQSEPIMCKDTPHSSFNLWTLIRMSWSNHGAHIWWVVKIVKLQWLKFFSSILNIWWDRNICLPRLWKDAEVALVSTEESASKLDCVNHSVQNTTEDKTQGFK